MNIHVVNIKLHPLSYNVRVTIYHLWQAGSALIIAYGIAIPHAKLWEQLIIVLLGLGYGSAAHVALRHTNPAPGADPGLPAPGPVVDEAPAELEAGRPADLPPSALQALERAVREAQQ
ncbi:hypothetical protein [Segniliparus rugosus]|uniref:Uncharacterized protein n=1 Tax=Segniliparus rugosus (strain ATCC BAA-974 / DSM 45345 / CCUG 50838 / CIP 108380 / JCM 13579 / CDC 945) TaxID=679197 RepID=E5XSG4_SEGRC|nr:hypothetical protein [Segniliparus rugosus]EFV12714.1 hypothetical protein HMPREF9336_02436 [Segniliparus rugosus ATCC BAA-974]